MVLSDEKIVHYRVPTMKLETYTRNSIFEKNLLMLLPFYIMRYEKDIHEMSDNSEMFQSQLNDYEEIRINLEKELSGADKTALYMNLNKLIIKIADYIFSDSEKTKKGVDRAMGGEVLELKTDKLINEIRQDVKEEVKEEIKTETKEKIVICMLKRGKSTLEEIAADTQMPIEQVERIKKEQQL